MSRDITDRIAKAHPWIVTSVEVIDNCLFFFLFKDFVSNVRHMQWAIPQTDNEASMVIQVRALFFYKQCFRDEIHVF